ncbi:response regulator transcription factor [Acinetobacter pragensis]|uniref:DNA-binding response regulator n=1 Tax=Acinetobacter pragensis TaxID=1806892 RepID=A0A151XYP3_9GAMM|nr:response regulator transcription factor [Acinetobacter pragensis]KYQ70784.1 DNA-binding response regulator [Acinetobacter pragensis]
MFDFSTPLLKPMLVLEDDPAQQKRISKILQAFGYEDHDIFYSQTIEFALNICSKNAIKFMLVDLNLPDGSGIDFIQNIKEKRGSTAPIMVLSAWNALETIYKALNIGATGYVLKEKDDFELMFAIRTMLKGGAIIDPKIANKILSRFKSSLTDSPIEHGQIHAGLSQRESEILEYVASGMSSREISAELNISKFTVDVHIKNIYQKLAVNSRTKAIHTAKQMGLIH